MTKQEFCSSLADASDTRDPFFSSDFRLRPEKTGHGAVLDHEVCTSRDGGDLPQELQGLELAPKGHCLFHQMQASLLAGFNLPAT